MTIRSTVASIYHATPWGRSSVDPNPFPTDAWSDARYGEWLEAHRLKPEELVAECQRHFENGPLFSIVVPLFHTPIAFFKDMANSVLAQTYEKFELVVVNASPEDAELARLVDEYAVHDTRVKAITLEANLGITENTLRGIDAAEGDFVGFLDHDDVIEPNLLFEYACALEAAPETDMLYCDEDLFEDTEEGRVFSNPTFKPAYSPELLLAKNYVVHMLTIRASVIRGIKRPGARMDAAQDYYFTLHAAQAARRVSNVQKVLYHFRQSATSTAGNIYSKPYGKRAACNLLTTWLENEPAPASVLRTAHPDIYQPWFSPLPQAKISVIVIDGPQTEKTASEAGDAFALSYCLEQLAHQSDVADIEAVVATSAPASALDAQVGFSITHVACDPGASRFARANAAAAAATGDVLVFLDAHSLFTSPEPLTQLVGTLTLSGVGLAAPKLAYLDGSIHSFGASITAQGVFPIGRGYPAAHPGYLCGMDALQNRSAVALDGMCVMKCVFDEAGGFDERFVTEIGTAEFCTRVRKLGLRIAASPAVVLQTGAPAPINCYVHVADMPDYSARELALFDALHPSLRAGADPYFNINLVQSNGYHQLFSSPSETTPSR